MTSVGDGASAQGDGGKQDKIAKRRTVVCPRLSRGGGVNAFSRYENGKTKPPLALVKLFKLLDRHPELLNEVRAA